MYTQAEMHVRVQRVLACVRAAGIKAHIVSASQSNGSGYFSILMHCVQPETPSTYSIQGYSGSSIKTTTFS